MRPPLQPSRFPLVQPVPGAGLGHNLFFAAVPPPEVAAAMAGIWARHGTGAPFRARTLHLTLLGLGRAARLDPAVLGRARRAGGALASPSFALRFDRLMTLGRADTPALILAADSHVEDVAALAGDLHDHARAAGLRLPRPALAVPHVTLAYGRGLAAPCPLPGPLWWHVREVRLIDSLQGCGTHLCLARWALPVRAGTGR